MCYAMWGIPVFGVFLVALGSKLNFMAQLIVMKFPFGRKHRTLARVLKTLTILIVGCVCFILLPALLFSICEKWSYSTSYYYVLVTLTTVGFGDYVPGKTFILWYSCIIRISLE